MSTIDNGGPVFPILERGANGLECTSLGIPLREYFAAHAPLPPENMSLDECAAFRFRYADAMLRARVA